MITRRVTVNIPVTDTLSFEENNVNDFDSDGFEQRLGMDANTFGCYNIRMAPFSSAV